MIKKFLHRLLHRLVASIALMRKNRETVIEVGQVISKQRCNLTVYVEETPDPKSLGNEVWLLDIEDESGVSIQEWISQDFPDPWQVKSMDGQSALVTPKTASLSLDLPLNAKLRFLKHPWSGIVKLEIGEVTKKVDLYSPVAMTTCWSMADIRTKRGDKFIWSHEEHVWISTTLDKKPSAVSILHPDWRGVRSATQNLVEYSLLVTDDLNEISAARLAAMICAAGCSRIFFGGFPISHALLVRALKKLDPEIGLYVFWLSSFMQTDEEYTWHAFQVIDDLCRRGLVNKWGFAKKGMAEIVGKTGVTAGFIASYVRNIPSAPSKIESPGGGPHFGLWALAPIWRKNPFAMLAALSEIPKARVTVTGQDQRVEEFARYLGLSLNLLKEPVDRENMPSFLARMDLNLYVTLSECSPMLPLESLAVGVPCLLGPNSHLFEDHPYLHSRLVVPYPDRSDIITLYIQQALEEREEIINQYREYAVEYNGRARDLLLGFLDLPDGVFV